MNKKLLSLLLVLALVVSLFAGCANAPAGETTTATAATTESTQPTETEPVVKAPELEQITIGTTSAGETATRDE